MLLIVEASPFPQLFGCIPIAQNSSYLASMYVILTSYDGGKFSISLSAKKRCADSFNIALLALMIARGVSACKVVFFLLNLAKPIITVRSGGKSKLTRVVFRDGKICNYHCCATPLV